ncbi:dihydroxyacetone kinase transcriptional activator DhaS [Vagococcus elongatus]|uniref:Dihydroxyacetone kinase transcriptional activator DhaS n=1 Tax=Vagococcus elongatus TaxID=180344 RepID=A0A430B1S4_9ENTE|nr:dihydroxyacetone kinase transcriptional activator DhaS [Vagococcus elongatus]RSU14270.1 dihydroxyacetone kinase transcriptional activator DhaS [Vagococcus elongatus]
MNREGSLITKKIIAYAFKNSLKEKEYHKISIKEIMADAGYRRQTFYDYFVDKEQLVLWICEQEITENIQHFIGYEHWTDILGRLLLYFNKNKLFYKKILISGNQQLLDLTLLPQIEDLMLRIMTEKNTSADRKKSITEAERFEISRFYAFAATGIIKDWVLNDCQAPLEEIKEYLIRMADKLS